MQVPASPTSELAETRLRGWQGGGVGVAGHSGTPQWGPDFQDLNWSRPGIRGKRVGGLAFLILFPFLSLSVPLTFQTKKERECSEAGQVSLLGFC